jgi:hypothetical protein
MHQETTMAKGKAKPPMKGKKSAKGKEMPKKGMKKGKGC